MDFLKKKEILFRMQGYGSIVGVQGPRGPATLIVQSELPDYEFYNSEQRKIQTEHEAKRQQYAVLCNAASKNPAIKKLRNMLRNANEGEVLTFHAQRFIIEVVGNSYCFDDDYLKGTISFKKTKDQKGI